MKSDQCQKSPGKDTESRPEGSYCGCSPFMWQEDSTAPPRIYSKKQSLQKLADVGNKAWARSPLPAALRASPARREGIFFGFECFVEETREILTEGPCRTHRIKLKCTKTKLRDPEDKGQTILLAVR